MKKNFENKRNIIIALIFIFIFISPKLFLNSSNKSVKILQVPVGNMKEARLSPKTILLNDGKVLVLGGAGKSAEIYNPLEKKFSYTGNVNYIRNYYTATLLKNGEVLLIGGFTASSKSPFEPIATAEIYNPTTKEFYLSGKMLYPREYHSSVLLKNGNVLITGGKDEEKNKVIANSELYDTIKHTFTSSSSMCIPRYNHSSILLKNGKVLIVGGKDMKDKVVNVAELYEPKTNIFKCIGKTNNKANKQYPILLNDGWVFIVGHGSEIYNPNTNKFNKINNNFIQIDPITLILPNNNFLIVSRSPIYFGTNKKNNAGLYNFKTNEYKLIPDILDGRSFPSIIQLKDKTILILGGCNKQGINNSNAYIIDTNNLK